MEEYFNTKSPVLRGGLSNQLKDLYETKLGPQFLRLDVFLEAIECANYLHKRKILLPGSAVTGEVTTVDSQSTLTGSNYSYVQENALTQEIHVEGAAADVESLSSMSYAPIQADADSNSDMNLD